MKEEISPVSIKHATLTWRYIDRRYGRLDLSQRGENSIKRHSHRPTEAEPKYGVDDHQVLAINLNSWRQTVQERDAELFTLSHEDLVDVLRCLLGVVDDRAIALHVCRQQEVEDCYNHGYTALQCWPSPSNQSFYRVGQWWEGVVGQHSMHLMHPNLGLATIA